MGALEAGRFCAPDGGANWLLPVRKSRLIVTREGKSATVSLKLNRGIWKRTAEGPPPPPILLLQGHLAQEKEKQPANDSHELQKGSGYVQVHDGGVQIREREIGPS